MESNTTNAGMPEPINQKFKLSITAAYTNCFNYLKTNAGTLIGLSVLSAAPFLVAGVLIALSLPENFDTATKFNIDDFDLNMIAAAAVAGVVGLVVSIRVQASLIATALQIMLHDAKPSFGEGWRLGSAHFGRTFSTSLLSGLAVIGGALLLVVPAFIFMTWYYLGIASAIFNQSSAGEALKDSKRLTEGYRWWIFGLIIINGILSGALGEVPVLGSVVSVVVGLLGTLFMPYIFISLKIQKDGGQSISVEHAQTAPTLGTPVAKTNIPTSK